MVLKVVIESPFGGSSSEIERNIEYAKCCVQNSLNRGEAPFAAHLLYTRFSDLRKENYEGHVEEENEARRKTKLESGYSWGKQASMVAVYTDLGISPGMERAINYYNEHGIYVDYRCLREDPETKPILLAISGKMASGKTTLGNQLVKHCPTKRIAFVSNAWPLKKVAAELCGMSLDEEKKDRPLLIDLGNVVREREINRLVNMAVSKALALAEYNDVVVIDDLRFANEAPVLREAGFKLVRCEVAKEIRVARIQAKYPKTAATHLKKLESTSETQLDDFKEWDMVIDTSKPVSRAQLKALVFNSIN